MQAPFRYWTDGATTGIVPKLIGLLPWLRRIAGTSNAQRVAYLAFCLSVVASAEVKGTGSPRQDPPSPPTIKVSTVVVNVYAVVEDKKGHLLSNLGKEDFTVLEDGQLQRLDYFSRETDAPLTLGIVIDTSHSQQTVLAIEKQEAKNLLKQVLGPKDSAFIIKFDLQVELLQHLTGDQDLLARAIDGTSIHEISDVALQAAMAEPTTGGSHLYDAVYLASSVLMKKQVGRKVLVLLTDGEDVGSLVTPETALEEAERSDVMIYSVAIGDRTFYSERGLGFHGDSVLKRLSVATGGRISQGRDARSTIAAFSRICGELRGQYLLGYTSEKPRDGSYRKISVKVHRGVRRVRARRGYYAQP
jgi:VWFA-related protein